MDKPAADNKPIVDTATAVRDVGSVVDFVRSRRHGEKVNLMGWSNASSPAEVDANASLDAILFVATHSATVTHTYRVRMTFIQRPFDVLIATG